MIHPTDFTGHAAARAEERCGVSAAPRRNLAAAARVHAFAWADSQEQVAADDASVGGQ
jgi:hypothetical protein